MNHVIAIIKLLPLLVLTIILLGGCSLIKYTVEHAPYTVLEEDEDIEIRHYQSMLFATTPMLPAQDGSDDSAFMRLFDYISGDNSKAQDISMTAPVFMDEKKLQKMSFVLPKDFSFADTPAPLSDLVKIEEVTDYTVAVIRFNGRLNEETVSAKKARLETWLQDKKLEVVGETMIAGYDPPSSLPLFRRNEVLIPIRYN